MYGKLFATLYEGSMVGAGPTVFAVWGYCIAKSEVDGTVLLNPALLAPIIGTSRVDIESAIRYLQEPDANSKNTDHEGRRLLHQTGHLYFIVSHEVYRGIKNNEDRREYMRQYMRNRRDKGSVNSLQSLQKLPKVYPVSVSASSSPSPSASPSADSHKAIGGGCKGEKKKAKTFKAWTPEEFEADVDRILKDKPILDAEEREKFLRYWSEPNPEGKTRLSLQPTWDTGGRMRTWRSNKSTFAKSPGVSSSSKRYIPDIGERIRNQ